MNGWRVNAFCRHGRGHSPLLFVWGGSWGIQYIYIYIYILIYTMYYTAYSVWFNLLQLFLFLIKFAKFFSAGFRVGWRDAMNDSNVSALCLRPWKNIVVIHSRAFWRWRYLGLFSMHNPGGIWFKIVLQIQFWMSKGFDFFGGGYDLFIPIASVYGIYIYILIYHKKLTIHVGRSTSHMDDTVDAWTPKQPPGDV